MCDVLLPPGVNPTAVKYTYIISYHIISCVPCHRITWLYNHVTSEFRSCNRSVRTIQGPCSHRYRRLCHQYGTLFMGKKEAKFTSMKYKDAKITTTLHTCVLNYFLKMIFQLDSSSIKLNHQYTCNHHTICCNSVTEYLETRLVLQHTVSRTAMRIHFYKNVPGSEWTYVSLIHLSDRPSI
jgi:hypothetical protein